jgi:recombination protein RecT
MANTQLSVVPQVKQMLAREDVKARFSDILGKKASQFTASLVNVVAASPQLKQSDPNSIMAAAFVAASFDLPIDSNLGFAAIVPYNKSIKNTATGKWSKVSVAQFQMMYKGYIQLAIRTGEYEKMNCSEVYQDELVSYNPITGECRFVDSFNSCTQRNNGEVDKIIGYYAWFKLLSGFTKELYMSKNEVLNHAKKYSQSYRYDLDANKASSKWSTDFDSMAKKTVIKQLLSKWGILSTDMQRAIEDDQKVYDDCGAGSYDDNSYAGVAAEDPFVEVDYTTVTEEPEEIDITEG